MADDFRTIHLAAAALAVLQARDGRKTIVRLAGGEERVVWNIGWEAGPHYDHVFANANPQIAGVETSYFYTNDIAAILAEDGRVILDARAA